MQVPRPDDAVHKAWMYRLLTAIADDPLVTQHLRFKGGTCAVMRGYLNRFSIDLDFDLVPGSDFNALRDHLESMFLKSGFTIADQSAKVPQYFLQYPHDPRKRNTIRVDVNTFISHADRYEPVHFVEIDRILHCQTLPTMVANKLIALVERAERHGGPAGRDVFDVHSFLWSQRPYDVAIIEDRTGKPAAELFQRAIAIIEKRLTQKIIDEDLNTLLVPGDFHQLRKILKEEILRLLRQELERVKRKK